MGTVNIFLGGIGKHIAEDIQNSRDFYGLTISEPVAFELDAIAHMRVELSAFVSPGQETLASVRTVANDWVALETGPHLGPDEPLANPDRSSPPSTPFLVAVGESIAANPTPDDGLYALRGHGLTVFSALFDDRLAIAGTGSGRELMAHINRCIANETIDGALPRINLIASTAGGTGAGTVVPLVLWLKREHPDLSINLIAVTPSAFMTVLAGSPALDDRAAKGRSGTYALLREISFFQDVDEQVPQFSDRHLPVVRNGLPYYPGSAALQVGLLVRWL